MAEGNRVVRIFQNARPNRQTYYRRALVHICIGAAVGCLAWTFSASSSVLWLIALLSIGGCQYNVGRADNQRWWDETCALRFSREVLEPWERSDGRSMSDAALDLIAEIAGLDFDAACDEVSNRFRRSRNDLEDRYWDHEHSLRAEALSNIRSGVG
jgi:hypothetical protein